MTTDEAKMLRSDQEVWAKNGGGKRPFRVWSPASDTPNRLKVVLHRDMKKVVITEDNVGQFTTRMPEPVRRRRGRRLRG